MKETSPAPEAVVQRQLDAYNARDLNALLAIYADNAGRIAKAWFVFGPKTLEHMD